MNLKLPYGFDPEPSGGGFYWPDSPAKRRELMSVKRGNPSIFESVYQCRPGRRTGAIFLENDFVYYKPPENLHLGLVDPAVREFCSRFYGLAAGWDTAMEATHQADFSVGVVAGLLPCIEYHRGEDPAVYGECEPHFDVYVLDITRKKLQWGDLAAEFRAIHRKWQPLRHVVEKKGSGIQLYQSMPAIGIDVEGVSANESKRARAISGTEAGSTQGWFRQHRIYFPYDADWLESYKKELKDFTGEDDSKDDQVDATVHLTNFAIQCGSSVALMGSDWTPERVDAMVQEEERRAAVDNIVSPPRSDMLTWLSLLPEASFGDPLSQCCGGCLHHLDDDFCEVHRRRVVTLDICPSFIEARADAEFLI